MATSKPIKIVTSCDATKLQSLYSFLVNKVSKKMMLVDKDRLLLFSSFVCSDGVTPVNILLGIMNGLIYVLLEELPFANYSNKDEVKQLVTSYLISTTKFGLMSPQCFTSFVNRDHKFWNQLYLHYYDKWTSMIDCIILELINNSNRYTGMFVKGQFGSKYPADHEATILIEQYQTQFWSVKSADQLFETYFEETEVHFLSDDIKLCFFHFVNRFSSSDASSLGNLLADYDGDGLRVLLGQANPFDGIVFIELCNFKICSIHFS